MSGDRRRIAMAVGQLKMVRNEALEVTNLAGLLATGLSVNATQILPGPETPRSR
jgi:hypothetical protein